MSVDSRLVPLETRYQREHRRRIKAEERAAGMDKQLRRFRSALEQIQALEDDWTRYGDVTGEKVATAALETARRALV